MLPDLKKSPSAGGPSRHLVLGLIVAAILGLAALHYWQFLQDPRPRWNGLAHDRNGHYEFAQKMALALREGDVRTFLATLEKSKVWPPVHGLLACTVLTFGGLDFRLAVLPSLAGWVMTAIFGFLLARRISGGCGDLAGISAVVLILASPAHRIYGTDIMLESLGAGLTMLALYLYAVARQAPTPAAWRRLAIALTVLFFEKYNYWLLVALALGLAEISGWDRARWRTLRDHARLVNWPRWIRAEAREPLNYLVVAVTLLTTAVFLLKPSPFSLGSIRVSVYPPNNLVTATYAIFFLRVMLEWRKRREDFSPGPLIRWHVLPIGISLLFPQRLSSLVWYLGPLNRGEVTKPPLGEAVAYYCDTLFRDYHISAWSAVAACGLFLLSLGTVALLRPGGSAPFILVLLSLVSVIFHPNQKSRFLHSWLAVGWVAGAAGLATGIARTGGLRRPLAPTAGTAVILTHIPFLADAGHAPETGLRRESTSQLDLADSYLPALAGRRQTAVFATTYCDQFVLWTHRERYHRDDAVELPLKNRRWASLDVEELFPQWSAATRADAVIFIEITSDIIPTPFVRPGAAAKFRELMRADPSFALLQQWELPQHSCTITLWERRGP